MRLSRLPQDIIMSSRFERRGEKLPAAEIGTLSSMKGIMNLDDAESEDGARGSTKMEIWGVDPSTRIWRAKLKQSTGTECKVA